MEAKCNDKNKTERYCTEIKCSGMMKSEEQIVEIKCNNVKSSLIERRRKYLNIMK